jgi:hypothetical protein
MKKLIATLVIAVTFAAAFTIATSVNNSKVSNAYACDDSRCNN